ncbi:hypothetical protein GQX73_g9963 [Xylaria multiplex]|uniref:Uncharacterized protein n=1 Tax=Xylaria multiplex TaxID=323545 RepID=A0A7C8IH84_9PEZI|nr:hypothetical protein GQX73_g9963 [Xylaria multiplex]
MTNLPDRDTLECPWPGGGKPTVTQNLDGEYSKEPWANQKLESQIPGDTSPENPGPHRQNLGTRNTNDQTPGDQNPNNRDFGVQNDGSRNIDPRDPRTEGTHLTALKSKCPGSRTLSQGLTPPSSSPTAFGALVTKPGSIKSSSTIPKPSSPFKSPVWSKFNKKQQRKENESVGVQEEAVKRLREQLKLGRLAICVGSSVTLYSASSRVERLSWWGLMSIALDYLDDRSSGSTTQRINQADASSARKTLWKDDLTEADRERAANKMQKILASRGDLDTTWMRNQFHNIYKDYTKQYEMLDAIKALHEQGAMLLTTNYDDSLENHCDLEPIDASDPNALISYQRGSQPGVFHTYGYWDDVGPSAAQYMQDKKSKVSREALQHILATRTVLFIGYGSGSAESYFGPLFEWIGKNVGASASHYILLQSKEPYPVNQLPLIRLRSQSYDSVPQFLTDLLDISKRQEGTLTELPHGSERARIHDWLAPIDQSPFLNDMWNLHGPNRFDRQVTQGQDIWALNTPSRVRLKGKARQPTNAELETVLIELLQQLNKPQSPKKGNPVMPGKTYLIIDELETLSPNMRYKYSKFIKNISSLPLEHLYLLVTAEDSLTLGIDPPPRPNRPQRGRERKYKSYKTMYKLAPKSPAKTGANVTGWAEVTLDWATTEAASKEWLRGRFNTDPSLANYVNIRHDLISEIQKSGQNLRWVYWKLNRLAEIGAAPELNDAELNEAAEAALGEVDTKGGDYLSEDGIVHNYDDSDDDYDNALPGRKRARERENPGNKRRKKSS